MVAGKSSTGLTKCSSSALFPAFHVHESRLAISAFFTFLVVGRAAKMPPQDCAVAPESLGGVWRPRTGWANLTVVEAECSAVFDLSIGAGQFDVEIIPSDGGLVLCPPFEAIDVAS